MADKKLWSPGTPRECWIIWYEDREGPGNMAVFFHKVEAENDISEMLRSVAGEEYENWDPADDDENTTRAVELLESVRKNLDKKRVWDAMADWEEYHGEYNPDQTVHVEQGKLYGAG